MYNSFRGSSFVVPAPPFFLVNRCSFCVCDKMNSFVGWRVFANLCTMFICTVISRMIRFLFD